MKSTFIEKLIINKDEKTKEKIREMSKLLDDSYEAILKKRRAKNYDKERYAQENIDKNKDEAIDLLLTCLRLFADGYEFYDLRLRNTLLIQRINIEAEERT